MEVKKLRNKKIQRSLNKINNMQKFLNNNKLKTANLYTIFLY